MLSQVSMLFRCAVIIFIILGVGVLLGPGVAFSGEGPKEKVHGEDGYFRFDEEPCETSLEGSSFWSSAQIETVAREVRRTVESANAEKKTEDPIIYLDEIPLVKDWWDSPSGLSEGYGPHHAKDFMAQLFALANVLRTEASLYAPELRLIFETAVLSALKADNEITSLDALSMMDYFLVWILEDWSTANGSGRFWLKEPSLPLVSHVIGLMSLVVQRSSRAHQVGVTFLQWVEDSTAQYDYLESRLPSSVQLRMDEYLGSLREIRAGGDEPDSSSPSVDSVPEASET